MSQCTAIKDNGERCRKPADGQQGLCWNHDPKNHAERVRTASMGGRGNVNEEAREAKEYLKKLRDDVRSGKCSTQKGAVVNQIVNTQLRAIELERRLEAYDIREEFEAYKAEVEDIKRELRAAN